MCLTPAHVHAHEHRRPVLALGTAGTRVDLHHTVHRVLLLAQHVHKFQVLNGFYGVGIVGVDLFLCHKLIFIEIEGELKLIDLLFHVFIS